MVGREVPDLIRAEAQLDHVLEGYSALSVVDLAADDGTLFRAALYANWGSRDESGYGVKPRAVGLARFMDPAEDSAGLSTIIEEHGFNNDAGAHDNHPAGVCRRFTWTDAGGLLGLSFSEKSASPDAIAAYLVRLLTDTCLSNARVYDPFHYAQPGAKDPGIGTMKRLRYRGDLFVHQYLNLAVQEALRRSP
jgi:hypothetical protein